MTTQQIRQSLKRELDQMDDHHETKKRIWELFLKMKEPIVQQELVTIRDTEAEEALRRDVNRLQDKLRSVQFAYNSTLAANAESEEKHELECKWLYLHGILLGTMALAFKFDLSDDKMVQAYMFWLQSVSDMFTGADGEFGTVGQIISGVSLAVFRQFESEPKCREQIGRIARRLADGVDVSDFGTRFQEFYKEIGWATRS